MNSNMGMGESWVLEAIDVHKRFGGVRALRGANLRVRPAEFHGLVGANGAGKSTLAKIIAGVLRPDRATIRLLGEEVLVTSPVVAEQLGIALVPQEPMLAPNLPVVGNLCLGRERPAPGGMLRKGEELRFAERLLACVGLQDLHPLTPVEQLNVAQRQLVQIARALGAEVKVLILDEPTSAITAHEAERLFSLTHRLKQAGTSIIYVSHRLEEIFEVCERVTVMRDGLSVAVFDVAEATPEQIVHAMAGEAGARAITAEGARRRPKHARVVLQVENLAKAGAFYDVSFSVAQGQILGIAGLVGSGRSELLQAIAGILRPDSGRVLLDGRPVRFTSPAQAISAGVVLLPEDRHAQGLFLDLAVRANISLPILTRLLALFWLRVHRERRLAREMVKGTGAGLRQSRNFHMMWEVD